ncbi:MAG: outer membrane protein transport protein [Marinilabiliaceae bacterium]|nr:outer membrane protein transport protein [Marinilabiliaceae bacterium]
MKKVLVLCALVLSGLSLMAEGYQVNMQSQRQTGMGHTGTGLLLGASSMHFNPGALGFLKSKYEFSAGMSGAFSNNTFQKAMPSIYETTSDNPMGTPFYFYGASRVNEKMVVGLSVTSPYGNSLSWGSDWDGRYLIQDIALKAIFIQPTLSYQFNEKLSVGAGFVATYGSVDLNKGIPMQNTVMEGSVNLTGDTWSYGYHAGITYRPTDKFTVGLDYRSKIVMKIEAGEANFDVPDALKSEATFPEGNTFDAEMPMPTNITFGLGYQLNEKWLVAADLQYVGWSAYESLDFYFEKNSESLDSENARNYDNTLIVRLGTEFTLSPKWQFRAGAYYDPTPIPENYLTPETPGTNKVGLSAGLSWNIIEKLSFDASLLYIHGEKREDGYADSNFYGTYYSNAILPGIGLTYIF